MASMMEVDPPAGDATAKSEAAGGSGGQQEKTLKVHPLAIIGISDHHTRVITGGSALPTTAPVMGLLFGYQDGLTVSIVDAEEMEYSFAGDGIKGGGFGGGTDEQQAQHKASIQTKIELHRKVFPSHEVIGWYRVSNDADGGPTEEDLRMNNGKMRDYNESPLFVLMNAGSPEPPTDDEKVVNGKGGSSVGEEAREKLERDEQLPLSIYETLVTVNAGDEEAQPRAVFVNLEFELETFEPERIAVEKVFKTQPNVAAVTSSTASKAGSSQPGKAGEDGEDGKEAAAKAAAVVPPSGLDMHLQSIQSSIQAMNTRVAVLIDYLKKTQSGEIPPNYNLLRQVDGLVRQLPFVMSSSNSRLSREFENEYDDMLMLSYLASVTKTAKAVQGYTEKFHVVYESNTTRDVMRRGY